MALVVYPHNPFPHHLLSLSLRPSPGPVFCLGRRFVAGIIVIIIIIIRRTGVQLRRCLLVRDTTIT